MRKLLAGGVTRAGVIALCWASTLYAESSATSSHEQSSSSSPAAEQLTRDCAEAGKLVSRGIQRSDGSEEEERLYRQASGLCEQMAEAHHNLGVVLERRGKLDEAAEAFKKALTVREDPSSRLALASTYVGLEQFEDAEREYQRVLDDTPRNIAALQGMAVTREKKGDLQGALDVLIKARGLEETNAVTLFNLGALYQRSGQMEAARESFEKAAYANPRSYEAQLFAGYLAIQGEDFRKAEPYLRKAIELDRREAAPHRALAYAYEMQDDFVKAEVSYRRAAELDRADREALLGLARVQLELGQPALAKANAGAVLVLDNKDFRGHGLQGWAFFELGDFISAEESFRKAVAANSSSAAAFYSLGLAQRRLGKEGEAEQNIVAAEQLHPSVGESFSKNGWRFF